MEQPCKYEVKVKVRVQEGVDVRLLYFISQSLCLVTIFAGWRTELKEI